MSLCPAPGTPATARAAAPPALCPVGTRPARAARLAACAALPLAVLTVVVGPPTPAHAEPATAYEMPFPCGQEWTGRTRDGHSPSRKAIDWNRPDDVDDPVVASASGTVTVADAVDNSGYGRWVVVSHGGGESTVYAHLNSVAVGKGQTISRGSQVGTVGSTGNSTGPHLHYEQRKDGDVVAPYFHGTRFEFGSTLASRNCGDVPEDEPLAGDLVSGAKAELVIYRPGHPSTWLIKRPGREPVVRQMGADGMDPVLGDWDGSGRVNLGVRNPETRRFRLRSPEGTTAVVFGRGDDRPVAGDWNGDGRWEVGVRRPETATFLLRGADGSVEAVAIGDGNDLPVTGDWNGDGVTDLAVYDSATARFRLRMTAGDGVTWFASVDFGDPGDLPVAGDWDGNGRDDLGVWDPDTGRFHRRWSPVATETARTVTSEQFGTPR